jgi:hypothetical protein
MPGILVALTQRLVRWGVLPRAQVPDSAIVNIYDEVGATPPILATTPACALAALLCCCTP